jgi:hypothetical protein
MEKNCSMFSSSVVDVDGHPHHSSVILMQPFLNMVIIFTYFTVVQQFPYCAESLGWISAPCMPLAHKNCITEHRSSLKHVESGVAMLTLLR